MKSVNTEPNNGALKSSLSFYTVPEDLPVTKLQIKTGNTCACFLYLYAMYFVR